MRAKGLIVFALLLWFFSPARSMAFDSQHAPDYVLEQESYYSLSLSENDDDLDSWWTWLKGRSARDALTMGMWSIHMDGSGDIFGSGRNNEHNHLLGIQYKGVNAGTFINSHDDRTYTVGLSREVYTRQISPDVRFDAGYKLGLLYGYKDNLPSIMDVSGYAMPVVGLSWKRVGFDIGLTPVGVLTFNFRVDIDRR